MPMILGRHMDGRALGYDESAYRFDLEGQPVAAAAVEAWDKMGLIAWGTPEQRQWFVGVGGARFDSVASQVASAAALLGDEAQPAAEQPVAETPAAEQPAGKPVWSTQPVEFGPEARAGLDAAQDAQPEPVATEQPIQPVQPEQPAQPGFAPVQQPVMQQPAGQPYPGPYPQPRSDRPVPPIGWSPQGQGAPAQQEPMRALPQQQPQQPVAWQPMGQQQWRQPYPGGYQPAPQTPQRKRGRIQVVIIVIVLIVIALIAIGGAWMLGTAIGHEILSGADPLSSLPNGMDGFNT